MEYFKICEKSHEFAEEIIKTKEFKRLKELKELISTECIYLLNRFNVAKENYNKAIELNFSFDNIAKARASLLTAKEALYTHPLVKEYKEIELKLQLELNKIAKELIDVVKGN